MNIYDFTSAVSFLNAHLKESSSLKRGLQTRMAEAAGVFPSYFSLILKDERPFSQEQAFGISQFLNFSDSECRYFLRLANIDRVTDAKLKKQLLAEIEDMRHEHIKISSRVRHEKVQLSQDDLEKFYSSWIYTAVRLIVAIPGHQTAPQIARALQAPEEDLENIVQFLVQKSLIKYEHKKLTFGPAFMHLDANSPLVRNHHTNWRFRALERSPFMNHNDEIMYSLATCLSEKDVEKIRGLSLEFIQKIKKIADPSPSEKLYCFNLDWFKV